jgi:hypothetical protein
VNKEEEIITPVGLYTLKRTVLPYDFYGNLHCPKQGQFSFLF